MKLKKLTTDKYLLSLGTIVSYLVLLCGTIITFFEGFRYLELPLLIFTLTFSIGLSILSLWFFIEESQFLSEEVKPLFLLLVGLGGFILVNITPLVIKFVNRFAYDLFIEIILLFSILIIFTSKIVFIVFYITSKKNDSLE
jgi:hypothetical protein